MAIAVSNIVFGNKKSGEKIVLLVTATASAVFKG